MRKHTFRYIVAQILGAYIACALVYAQYKVIIDECEAVLTAAGKLDAIQFTPNGPAGIFALYLLPGQSLGRVFLNEFVNVRWNLTSPNTSPDSKLTGCLRRIIYMGSH